MMWPNVPGSMPPPPIHYLPFINSYTKEINSLKVQYILKLYRYIFHNININPPLLKSDTANRKVSTIFPLLMN